VQTFLFAAGLPGDLEGHLQAISSRATPFVPQSSGTNSAAIKVVPEIAGGWVTWTPSAAPAPWLDEHSHEDLLVLSFGDLADGTRPARRIAHEFQTGGTEAVRKLNGTFCAILIERRAQRIQVLTDRVGRLAATCWVNDNRLHVTVHEVLLGVCGCPFDLDPVSAASIVGCGWSVSGAPLNRNLTRIDGRHKLIWIDGQSQVVPLPLFGPGSRLDATDSRAIRNVVGSMCELVTRAAHARAVTTVEVEAGLTAGLDSRAVLGALLSGFERDKIKLYTTGTADSQDVRVAARIAHQLGLHHEQRPLEAPTADSFQAHDSLRAFMANGDTSARGSLAPIPESRAPGRIIAGGGGGEIVRGFYYRIAGNAVERRQVVRRLCSRKFVRLGGLGMSPGLVDNVTSRIDQCFESYAALSTSREDWLDLFYLHERFAHFAAPSARKQDAPRWLPFADTNLLELAWQLPAPLGAVCDIHRQLIQRFLPRQLYWTPLNGKHPPALEGPGRTKKVLREAAFLLGHARKRLSKRSAATTDGPTAEGLLATTLYDYARELLTRQGSLALAVFGGSLVDRLLQEHRSRRNQIEALGPLLNMEHYRQLYARAFEARIRE
jgi:asparagine synthetase B (glutamine-hydrolysing)